MFSCIALQYVTHETAKHRLYVDLVTQNHRYVVSGSLQPQVEWGPITIEDTYNRKLFSFSLSLSTCKDLCHVLILWKPDGWELILSLRT